MNRLALESRPPEWEDGSLLPASPDIYNTGFMKGQFELAARRAWQDHLDFLSHAGSVAWRHAASDVQHRGVSYAAVDVMLPEYVERFGRDRYLVGIRAGDRWEPRSDIPEPGETVLVYTDSEWEAFVGGAKDREFDLPETRLPHVARPALGAGDATPPIVIEGSFTLGNE